MHKPYDLLWRAKHSLRLASLERIPLYLQEQRVALLRWFDSENGPANDPIIEFDPPFEPAPGTWDDLVTEGFLHVKTLELLKLGGTTKGDRPFLHQWRAIVAAKTGKTVVVSAGTGSGKTECFLIPILDSLVREAIETQQPLAGLRSMLIYPLNALVFDQMGRWRAVLRHQEQVLGFEAIRLGMYNGHLRRDEDLGQDLEPLIKGLGLDPKDQDLSPYIPMPTGEIRRRQELLAGGRTGVNLLITNYCMLELALLRPSDQTWLNEARNWKHIVLDEAHTYTGGLALDLTLLLRRLRDRVRPRNQIQGFATSATFGGEGVQDLRAFAATMFGVGSDEVQVIQGTRIPIGQSMAAAEAVGAGLPKLIQHLVEHQDQERLRPLYFKASDLKEKLFTNHPQAQPQLEALLQTGSRARTSDNQRALLPHRLHASLRAPMEWPTVCINSDCPGKGIRTSDFTWPGLGWTGLDVSDDCCPHCNSPMLQPVTCDNEGCAKEGLLARASSEGFPPRSTLMHPGQKFQGSLVLVAKNVLTEGNENNFEQIEFSPDGSYHLAEPDSAWRLYRVDVEGGAICPRCQEGGTLRPTWKGLFPRGMRDLVVLDTALAALDADPLADEKEPGQGRRILAFSDSRQGAARLAPRLAFTHRALFVRRWLLDSVRARSLDPLLREQLTKRLTAFQALNDDGLSDQIRTLEAQLSGSISLMELLRAMAKDRTRLTRWARSLDGARFMQRIEGNQSLQDLVPGGMASDTAWYGLIRSELGQAALLALSDEQSPLSPAGADRLFGHLQNELLLALCRELFRTPGRTATALKLALIEPVWRVEDGISCLDGLGLSADLRTSFLQATLHHLLERGCVEPPLGVRRDDEDFGQAHLGLAIVLQEGNPNDRIFSIASERPESRILTAMMRVVFGQADTTIQWEMWLRSAGLSLWKALLKLSEVHGGPFRQQTGADGQIRLVLMAEALRFKQTQRAHRCLRCGRPTLYGALKNCPLPRFSTTSAFRSIPCAGELVKCDPWEHVSEEEDANPHTRRLMIESDPPEGLSAFEHTAQRSKEGLLRDELLFRRRQMNFLSSSTTLEMGIDLPDLDCVALLGVPPAASNHTQRVGRAGRSRQRSSMAITLAGGDSFDRWAFRDPMAFLHRRGITPRVDLERPSCLAHHFFAWRLGQLVSTQILFCPPGKDSSLLQRLEQFAGLDSDHGPLGVKLWNESKRPPWTRSDAFPGWGDDALRLWCQVEDRELERASKIFGRSASDLALWLKEGESKLKHELSIIRKRDRALTLVQADAEGKRGKFYRKLQHSLREYKTLTWLAERNVLPRYGFPISTVTLQPPKRLRDLGIKEGVQRDRRLAIFEWAPGSKVVVAGREWTPTHLSEDVARGDKETHHRHFSLLICLGCECQQVIEATQPTLCGTCGSPHTQAFPIAVPNGFRPDAGYRIAGTSQQNGGGGGRRILSLNAVSPSDTTMRFLPDTRVAFINPGEEDETGMPCGFVIDPITNELTHASPKKKLAKRKGQDANGSDRNDITPVLLGEVQQTDVLRFQLPESTEPIGLRSAAHALRIAAAFILEMDPRSLCLGDQHPRYPGHVDLVDLTPGGSGLLARLLETGRTQEWIQQAIDIASHQGRTEVACVNACPECLLTHDNRFEHMVSPFRRRLAEESLRGWLAEVSSQPT